MKFFAFTLATALLAIPRALSQSEETVSVSFDRTYDNPAGDTNTVACSNGINGLARCEQDSPRLSQSLHRTNNNKSLPLTLPPTPTPGSVPELHLAPELPPRRRRARHRGLRLAQLRHVLGADIPKQDDPHLRH